MSTASGRIAVYLGGHRHDLVVGSRVHDLLALQSPEVRLAVANGRARLVDERGNEIGSAGDLSDGQHLDWVFDI